MAETTPVTVLTGFLGAGKTTLLNHLLRRPELSRAAVLVNEFGEIGIDHLLVEKLGDSTVLLNAGCLCCTVRGDLVRVLRDMLPRARRDEISRVIIETTGLADPIPILTTLMTDPVAAAAYRLHGVVTVVDAVNGPAHLDAQVEAVRQVAVADRIIISKSDLADAAPLRARLRLLNPGAPVTEARHGAIDPTAVLNAGRSEASGRIADLRGWLAAGTAHDRHGHDLNRHHGGISAFCLMFGEPVDWTALEAALRHLLASHGDHILRVKGILEVGGSDQPLVVHAVRHLLHAPFRLKAWPEGEARCSRLIFVTRDLPRSVVEAHLAEAQPSGLRSARAAEAASG